MTWQARCEECEFIFMAAAFFDAQKEQETHTKIFQHVVALEWKK